MPYSEKSTVVHKKKTEHVSAHSSRARGDPSDDVLVPEENYPTHKFSRVHGGAVNISERHFRIPTHTFTRSLFID